MNYVSTRGQAPTLGFSDVVTAGLATDGGLYVPEKWPTVDPATMRRWQSCSYAELATEIMAMFANGSVPRKELERMADAAYGNFSHPAVAPLVQLEEKLWVLELFHGPTLAFKDFAMQYLGQLFEYILTQSGEHRTIVGATSGDTGSAAIESVRGLEHVELFMLFPNGRVSDVQRRQMTTVTDSNIHTVAVTGDFDDCQRLLKAMFHDSAFRDEMNLSVVNSINWARVAAQVVYYFWSALSLGAPERPVSFSVPSGNFGNVFAGYVARKMGLPIKQLVVGSNHNDSLTRFFSSGTMKVEGVQPSLTPSMDVQVSSNFERLLFELTDRNGAEVAGWMDQFARDGQFSVTEAQHRRACELFAAGSLSNQDTQAEMKRIYESVGYVIDPHSAIGTGTARQVESDEPMIVLATAHPAKFPQAVQEATGCDAPLPKRVEHIMTAPEQFVESAAELDALQRLIREGGGSPALRSAVPR